MTATIRNQSNAVLIALTVWVCLPTSIRLDGGHDLGVARMEPGTIAQRLVELMRPRQGRRPAVRVLSRNVTLGMFAVGLAG